MFALYLLSITAVLGQIYAISDFKTGYYNQTLDHVNNFNPSNPKWSHRFLFNDEHWGKKALSPKCPGPILMYTGNEAPITAFWGGNGFMIDYLAPKWGALIFFPEQRYYGESIPSASEEYLTTQQVLEDFVEILSYIKSEYGAENCPVISFGGSYGATLTTYMRAAYPAAVAGGLASSSELGYYDPDQWAAHGVDKYTFSDIVTKDYDEADPKCLDAIYAAKRAIDTTPMEELVTAFNLCDLDGSALGPHKTDLFLYGLEGLCQQNYPYQIDEMPAWPVNAVCNVLVGAYNDGDSSREAMLAASVSVTYTALGLQREQGCVQNMGRGGPGNIPGDGPGDDSWGYQSCTETIHMFSSRGIREYEFDYHTSGEDPCMSMWGVSPNTKVLTERYGGFALGDGDTDITNIIWSTGGLDPWSGGGFKKAYAPADATDRGVYYFHIEKGAHHLDLRGPHPQDPEEVTQVRDKEERIMWGWIQDFIEKH